MAYLSRLFFFFGVATCGLLGQFIETLRLYVTPGGNALHTSLTAMWDSHRARCRTYRFRPGGHFGSIPTKTPVLPHQFLVLCRLSRRQSFHVFRMIFGFIALDLNILLFVCTLSILRRVFIVWSHLLWIS